MDIPPVVYGNGHRLYDDFSRKYVKHDKGLFIVAPSGSGKTHFCKNQSRLDWIDGDELWMAAGAHPDGPWWKEPLDVINRIDRRSDVITMEAKAQGLWIMGASNLWLQPDAIVIPDWQVHKIYINSREESNYDGGATSSDYSQVQGHIEIIKKWNTDFGVPLYKSIKEAVSALTV